VAIEKTPILDFSLNRLSDHFVAQLLLKKWQSLKNLVLVTNKLICKQLDVKRANVEESSTYLIVTIKLYRSMLDQKQYEKNLDAKILVKKKSLENNEEEYL